MSNNNIENGYSSYIVCWIYWFLVFGIIDILENMCSILGIYILI